jgi:AraC-like DNA-binding protein
VSTERSRPAPVVRRESDVTRMSFPFELLHSKGTATNMKAFHWHDFMELSFVRAGAGTYEIEDKTFTVGPGDIVIINDVERHRVTYDPAVPLRETVLHFSADLLAAGGRTIPLFRYRGRAFPNRPVLGAGLRRALRRLVGEIRREWDGRGPWFETLIRAKLIEIACLLLRAQGATAPEPQSARAARRKTIARLEQVLAWLRSNFQRPVQMAAIARRFGMRPSSFSDFFRRNLGVTFTEYLMQLRVSEAARRIEEGTAGSAEAAFACGFATRASFYRAFRKVMGASPGEWLRARGQDARADSKKVRQKSKRP